MEKKRTQNRIPAKFKAQIEAELGTMPDTELAAKYSQLSGVPIDRHTIFWMRKVRGIPAFHKKSYTKPPFRGRLEDIHPEVKYLFGKVPIAKIAEYFGVSRSCVRAAADRLGISNPGVLRYDQTVREILREHQAGRKFDSETSSERLSD